MVFTLHGNMPENYHKLLPGQAVNCHLDASGSNEKASVLEENVQIAVMAQQVDHPEGISGHLLALEATTDRPQCIIR